MHMGAAHLIPCQLLVLLPGPSGHALVCALLCDKVEQAIVLPDVMTSCTFIVFILSLSVAPVTGFLLMEVMHSLPFQTANLLKSF